MFNLFGGRKKESEATLEPTPNTVETDLSATSLQTVNLQAPKVALDG